MDYRWFIVDGCDRHYGDVVPSPQKYKTQACRNPAVPEIPRRNKPHTVQDEVDAAVTAWEQGFYSNSTQNDRCPLCRADTAPTVVVAQGTWAPTVTSPSTHTDTRRSLVSRSSATTGNTRGYRTWSLSSSHTFATKTQARACIPKQVTPVKTAEGSGRR